MIGGATRDRTADLMNANHALSQLSYSPKYSLYCLNKSACQVCEDRGEVQGSVHPYTTRVSTMRFAKLVGLGGFEPPTSPLSGVRSNQLSYRPFLRAFTQTIVTYYFHNKQLLASKQFVRTFLKK